MFYTKSLFVNFVEAPHLAWWAVHDKKWVYQQILDAKYGAMDGLAIGQAVEDAVLQTLKNREITTVDTRQLNFNNWHQSYHDLTMDLMSSDPDVLYQPSFVYGTLFCKCDILVRNAEGTYDLREVKAKNSVRKKTKDAPLLDDMSADVSFQHYVLSKVLGEKYSGRCFFVHLNKEYVRQGEVDYHTLIHNDDVSEEVMTADHLEHLVTQLQEAVAMNKEELDTRYPYKGDDYLTYFGEQPPVWSIWKAPRSWRQIPQWYVQGKVMLDDFNEMDIGELRNKDGELTTLGQYLNLWNQGEETIVNAPLIRQQMAGIQFPIYFYDYETVTSPVPLFQWTSPWQQVVTQYSCHKLDADGTITHTEGIIDYGETDNKRVIQQLLEDLDHGDGGSYVVRYKWFENSRNKELAAMYPEYEDDLLTINEKTFDLMEVFSTLNYFDRRFQWSSSVKKVLPVLTDISYDAMSVPNGAIAADLLTKIASQWLSPEEAEQTRKDLLEYCKQDTWAMVAIYNVVNEQIKSSQR